MFQDGYNGAIAYCTKEAVLTALVEAKATPIEIGVHVGHTDFATHGIKSGILQGYEGDQALVKSKNTDEEWTWPTEGMVSTQRVYDLAEQYLTRMETLMSIVELGEMIGVPPEETLSQILGPANPDCQCDYCSKRKAAEATDGSAGGAPEQISEGTDGTSTGGGVQAETATVAEATGARFPFDQFLNSVKAD